VEIDNNVWLLLLLNITLILASSWVCYKFSKRSTLYSRVSECNSTISRLASNLSAIFVNRYLMIRRLIKIDSDDDVSHHFLSLQSQN